MNFRILSINIFYNTVMKNIIYSLFSLLLLSILTSCGKPSPHPKHPNYVIEKPDKIYEPKKENLEKMINALQGSPYVWAEEGPNNFDCSGFTYYLYGSMGIELPRVARKQARRGKKVSANNLQYGDLIFFATGKRNRRKITHVGVYLGNGWFTHASTVEYEVVYSNLFSSKYYKNRLRTCRRYLPDEIRVASADPKPWEQQPEQVAAPIEQPIEPIAQTEDANKSKAIVIQAPINEIEQTSKEGNFYVQVGSFVGEPKKDHIAAVTRNGFAHTIIKFPKDGKLIHKLLVGPYVTRDEATAVLSTIRANIQPDAFIAEIR